MGPCGHFLHWECWKGTFKSQGRAVNGIDRQDRDRDIAKRKVLARHLQRTSNPLLINSPCCRTKIWSQDLFAPGVVFGDQEVRQHEIAALRNAPGHSKSFCLEDDDDSIIDVTDIIERAADDVGEAVGAPAILSGSAVAPSINQATRCSSLPARSDRDFPEPDDLSMSILDTMAGRMRTVGVVISAFRSLEFELQDRYNAAQCALESDFQSRTELLRRKTSTIGDLRRVVNNKTEALRRREQEVERKFKEASSLSAEAERRLVIVRNVKLNLDKRQERLCKREKDFESMLRGYQMGDEGKDLLDLHNSKTKATSRVGEDTDTDDNDHDEDEISIRPTGNQSQRFRKRKQQ